MYQIIARQQHSENTFQWDVYAPDIARAAKPGQFTMVRMEEGGERIPLTIADFDVQRGLVTLVVQALGKTTERMMRRYQAGDWFLDFAGPLGLPSHVANVGHVVLVGGGLGVAPIFPQLRALKQAGNRTTAIIGFRSKDLVFWEDQFRPWCDELIVCTDDGSYGHEGRVTAALEPLLTGADRPDLCIAIGPMVMMEACAETTRPHAVPTVVSLNAIMVDGTGMCGSCRVTIGDSVRFACVDGPDFDAHLVDFGELKVRQRRFASQERTANERNARTCSLEQLLLVDGKRNYKKFKELDPKAAEMPERDAEIRSRTFDEVNLGYSMATAVVEAERCIQCKMPTCIAGCPVGIDIPGFLRHLLVEDLSSARDVIQRSNLFPSICGRVCPQESQCEAQCILGKRMEPVAIGRLERFVGDHAPPPLQRPVPSSPEKGRVAIVGSGPAGLACAGDLAREGIETVVYEALHVVGGVLRYGIPSFRLPRSIIDREVQALRDLGVRFEINKVIGRTFTISQLLEEQDFDAVFVGTGAGYPMFLGLNGESAGQVYSANEFLTRVNLMGGGNFPFEDTPVAMGDKIVVIGAGNTAMDCLRVSKRLGAAEVRCVYRRTEAQAPARVEEVRHAKEEGIHFSFLRSPTAIEVDDDGQITAIVTQVMELGEPDASGRRRPVAVEGEFETFEADTVIYALGTRANPIIAQTTPDLGLNKWGYIEADSGSQATNLPGVFAGGDIVTGGATVIMALGAGRRAAAGITSWLAQRSWPPTLAESEEPAARAGCPRCHAPLEDGESYVCCAGTQLTWSCSACHKVSEGFAFPYGLCPACGGTLLKGASTGPVSDQLQDAVRQAFEIELGGRAFYRQGAARTSDPDLRALFEDLSAMEEEHLGTLARRYHLPAPPLEEVDWEQVAVYAGAKLPDDSATSLLELALALERRARDAVAARARDLERGTPEWRLYRELEAEEADHVATIATALNRWKAGKPGLI